MSCQPRRCRRAPTKVDHLTHAGVITPRNSAMEPAGRRVGNLRHHHLFGRLRPRRRQPPASLPDAARHLCCIMFVIPASGSPKNTDCRAARERLSGSSIRLPANADASSSRRQSGVSRPVPLRDRFAPPIGPACSAPQPAQDSATGRVPPLPSRARTPRDTNREKRLTRHQQCVRRWSIAPGAQKQPLGSDQRTSPCF